MRRAAKPDANQEAIRTALRKAGAVVIPCGQLEGAAETARAALIADHSWTITDGGPV